MVRNYRTLLLATASLAMAAGAAHAQEDQVVGLEEIVITAERTESTTQRTAIAITAVSGDAITQAGVTAAADLSKLVPGLEISPNGTLNQIYLRGVGSFSANSYAEAAVAFNVDGAYVARPTAIGGNFYDLERVEVLKGPQGTLYGRNATGGAINLITRKPVLGEYSGAVNLDVGNYDLVKVDGAINLPLTDSLAGRVAFQSVRHDGYLSDGYSDQNDQSVRGHLLYQPTDDVSLLLSADYAKQGGKGSNPVLLGFEDSWIGPSDPRSQAAHRAIALNSSLPPFARGLVLTPDNSGFVDNDTLDLRAELNWNMGWANLTVLPDFRKSDVSTRFFPSGFRGDSTESSEQRSLEVRLANTTDRLKWVVGAYYFEEEQDTNFLFSQGVNTTNPVLKLENQNVALFGQATYGLTDTLRLTAGIRYTEEEKSQNGTTTCGSVFCLAAIQGVPQRVVGNRSWDDTSYKLGVEWDLAEQSMLYANVSTAFKAGGFFAAIANNSFEPEKLTAFAIGSKNRFFDNRLQLNAEVFYWEYEDHQEAHSSTGLVAPGVLGTVFITENIGKSEIQGVDLEADWLVTQNDRLSLKVTYLDAEATDFTYRAPTVPQTGCRTGPGAPIVAGGAASVLVNCSGRPLPKAPEWSGSVAWQHTFDLNSGASVVTNVSTRFSTEFWGSIAYFPGELQDDFTQSDASITYNAPDERWSVTAYVNNIEDDAVIASTGVHSFIPAVYQYLRPPRTYGLRLNAKFGGPVEAPPPPPPPPPPPAAEPPPPPPPEPAPAYPKAGERG